MNRISNALDNLLIKSKGELNSRIEEVSFSFDVNGTKTKGYCYCLKTDLNGNLRLNSLIEYIDEKILDYAIPKKELDEARKYLEETGSSSKFTKLRRKAEKLFTDLEKTGEGGEILLYILVQEYLKIPQLISKMSLKTSGQVHYQGADGIHVKYEEETQALGLYWGESKMYANLNDAMRECFDSLKEFILQPQSSESKRDRDLQLITSNIASNVNNVELEDLLVKYFDLDDEMSNKIIYKGICFIGFDYKDYMNGGVAKTTQEVKLTMQTEVQEWYKKMGEKIKVHPNLDLKELHVFLMPFPSVSEFREFYLKEIK